MKTFLVMLLAVVCALTAYWAEGWNSILLCWLAFIFGLFALLFVITPKGEKLIERVDDCQEI